MTERAQSFAAIQSLMNTNAMHRNSVANIDQLKNNYAQQTDQETNKASEDITDAFGGILGAKALEGTADKLKKKIIAKTGDFVGKKVQQSLEEKGLVKSAKFVERMRSGGVKKAIGGAIRDAQEVAKQTASDAVDAAKNAAGDVVGDAADAARGAGDVVGDAARGAVEHLGQKGRDIIDLFKRGASADLDRANPFQVLSGDAQRALQEGGGGGAKDVEVQLQKLASAAVDNSDVGAGIAGEAEGAASDAIGSALDAASGAQEAAEVAARQVGSLARAGVEHAAGALAEAGDGAAQAAAAAAESAGNAVASAVADTAGAAAADAAAAAATSASEAGIIAAGETATTALTAVDAVDQEIPGLDVVTDLATLGVGAATIIAGQLFRTHSSEAAQNAQDAIDKASAAASMPAVGYEIGDK